MKMLLDAGLMEGDCLTVTGRTLRQNLEDVQVQLADQDVVYAIDRPLKPTGGILVIKGNLAPDGAVLKSSGVTIPPASRPGPGVREGGDRTAGHSRGPNRQG